MLDKEYKYYKDNQKVFLDKYKNRVLVIIGEKIVDIFEDEATAYQNSVSKYELGTFLIQKCVPEEDTIQTFHSRVILSWEFMQDFQAFTIKFSARTNVLFSRVGVSEAFNLNSDPKNHKPITEILSIWDTGASCSVITKKMAERIGLIPTGRTTITSVNLAKEENTFLVNIFLPNKVCMVYVKIAEVPDLTNNAGMLIGMDIIGSGDFSVYTKNGKTVMSYWYPSIGGTDFVVEAGNIRSNRSAIQKIDEQRMKRRPLSKKEMRKRKQERKNKKRHNKNKRWSTDIQFSLKYLLAIDFHVYLVKVQSKA